MPGADGGARRPASPSGGAAAPLAAALGALAGGLVFLAPRLERLGGAARRLPAAYASLLLGAALLFFGGAYRATIAAVEAWRLTADEAVKKVRQGGACLVSSARVLKARVYGRAGRTQLSASCHVGSTEGVRWKGYKSKLLHAAAFRVAKTP